MCDSGTRITCSHSQQQIHTLIDKPTHVAPPNQEDQMSHIMKQSPYGRSVHHVSNPICILPSINWILKYTKPQLSVNKCLHVIFTVRSREKSITVLPTRLNGPLFRNAVCTIKHRAGHYKRASSFEPPCVAPKRSYNNYKALPIYKFNYYIRYMYTLIMQHVLKKLCIKFCTLALGEELIQFWSELNPYGKPFN